MKKNRAIEVNMLRVKVNSIREASFIYKKNLQASREYDKQKLTSNYEDIVM